VPRGEIGRIFVGNEMQFEGYTNGNDKERALGLMSTGDRGVLDEHNLLTVLGRDDDMVIVGGENVYPIEVEELLIAQPEIKEVVVVGVPDDALGSRLAAYVVLHDGAYLSDEDVRGLVRQRLAKFSVPRDVVFLGELPRNATGKVVPRLLRRRSRRKVLGPDAGPRPSSGPGVVLVAARPPSATVPTVTRSVNAARLIRRANFRRCDSRLPQPQLRVAGGQVEMPGPGTRGGLGGPGRFPGERSDGLDG
jgi:hypothetical protein